MLIRSVGELSRRAPVRGDHEQLLVALLQVAGPVESVVDRADHLRWVGPHGPFRSRGHLHKGRRRVGDVHGEGDRFAVGRPGRVAGRRREVREFRGLAVVHPAAPELGRPAGVRDVHEPLAVNRPARRVIVVLAGREWAMIAAVGADDPEVGSPPVLHHVHEVANVDDLAAVRRDLRVGRVFELKNVHRPEPVGGRVVRPDRR